MGGLIIRAKGLLMFYDKPKVSVKARYQPKDSIINKDAASDWAVCVNGISKVFRIYNRPSDRLLESIVPRYSRYNEFQALKDVDFKVKRGQTVGIVGQNGSGKSTLLQIICGTLQPTSGSYNVNGRIAALLELGAGFNAEFTGRENIHLNATILGMSSKDILERFDEIVAFSGLEKFIDQPIKTYSSGMFVRLAFATAINSDPDILVVDEALSVGDEAFQRKCFAKIEQIQARGGTILFVSHSPGSVLQLCSHAILLDAGEVLIQGSPKLVIGHYQRMMNLTGDAAMEIRGSIKSEGQALTAARSFSVKTTEDDSDKDFIASKEEARLSSESFDPDMTSQSIVEYESQGAKISNMGVFTSKGRQVNRLKMGEIYTLSYDVFFDKTALNVGFGMLLKTIGGIELAGGSTSRSKYRLLENVVAGERCNIKFEFKADMMPGSYFFNAGVTQEIDGEMSYMHRILDGIIVHVGVEPDIYVTGLINILNSEPQISPLSK